MIGGLFGDNPITILFGPGDCPDSVPLRILGLDAIPLSRDTLRSVFRAKVMVAHPDLAAYTAPDVRQAAEAAVAAQPDVQELLWARNVLLRKIPEPLRQEPAFATHANSRNDRRCPNCKDERRDWRGQHPDYGRWARYCYPCADDAENARQRDLRAQARADRKCEGCGAIFTPGRADGRFCSSACRQAAYRKRTKTPAGHGDEKGQP
jgi:hypothetical protein